MINIVITVTVLNNVIFIKDNEVANVEGRHRKHSLSVC